MSEEPEIGAFDVAEIGHWLNDPSASLVDLMALYPFLRTEDEARRFLAKVKAGLADLRAGRTVSHDQIRRDVEERRQRYGLSAAE
jgi:hypothetical protein